MEVADAATPGDRFVQHGSARHLFDVLPEVPDREPLRHRHIPIVRRLFPDDHPEEGGLAGAVRPDEADPLAWIELKGGIDEQNLPAVLFVDSIERDHEGENSVLWGQAP